MLIGLRLTDHAARVVKALIGAMTPARLWPLALTLLLCQSTLRASRRSSRSEAPSSCGQTWPPREPCVHALIFFSCLCAHSKCLEQRLWDDSPDIFRQLGSIGLALSRSLQAAGVQTFAQLEESSPAKLEHMCGRREPFGRNIKEALREVPQYVLVRGGGLPC